MGFKIKNSLTGEFEKLPILTLKGEKGETGGVEEYNKVDYMGNKYETLKQANDANVEYAVKTAIGEFNYLDYDGQHITATDTIAGQAKNAVIKGQTLVNLSSIKDEIINSSNTGKTAERLEDIIKPNTSYICFVDIKSSNKLSNITYNQMFRVENEGKPVGGISGDIFTHYTRKYFKFTTGSSKSIFFVMRNAYHDTSIGLTENTLYIKNVVLLEYQEGMENWDIPYFTGMKSVQMPVLTTTGKNLFDFNKVETDDRTRSTWDTTINNGVITSIKKSSGGGEFGAYATIKVEPSTSYTLKMEQYKNGKSYGGQIYVYNNSSIWGNGMLAGYGNRDIVISTNADTKYITIGINYDNDIACTVLMTKNIQLEQSSTSTPYEPYKSNVLTVNEPIELRGIDDVKDELNVATGEVVQNIYAFTLDGSQNIDNEGDLLYYNLPLGVHNNKSISDKLPSNTVGQILDGLTGIAPQNRGNSSRVYIKVNGITTKEKMKNFFLNNPTTIQLMLETPTIKTVDLSTNHVYSYQDTTHYSFETKDNSLIPTLSLDVPTKLNALVARQKDTIQELTQENESLKAAQQILLNSQLSFYETLVSAIPALAPTEGQVIIPDFIQDLYRLKNNQK